MEGIIYKYTNKVNGKVYIGQTLDEGKRYRDHKYCNGKCVYFHSAIKKYGFENFEYEVIFRDQFNNVNDAKIVLDDRERQAILDYMSWDRDKGYNLTTGGGGSGGYEHTDEHKSYISQKLKGIPRSKLVKDKIKESHKRFYKPVYVDGVRFESIREAERHYNLPKGSIRSALKHRCKTYGHIVCSEGSA